MLSVFDEIQEALHQHTSQVPAALVFSEIFYRRFLIESEIHMRATAVPGTTEVQGLPIFLSNQEQNILVVRKP